MVLALCSLKIDEVMTKTIFSVLSFFLALFLRSLAKSNFDQVGNFQLRFLIRTVRKMKFCQDYKTEINYFGIIGKRVISASFQGTKMLKSQKHIENMVPERLSLIHPVCEGGMSSYLNFIKETYCLFWRQVFF